MRSTGKSRNILTVALIAGVTVIVLFYAIFDPELPWMPKCMFHALTGWNCPGCGSQRAIHALLHGRVADAWSYNALVVCLLPLMALWTFAEFNRTRRPKLYARLNSVPVIIVVSAAIVIWFIISNSDKIFI